MNNLERAIIKSKPVQCGKCKGRIFYVGEGKYYCKTCGHETLDDFGKIKEYIGKGGPTSLLYMSQATGVDLEMIEIFMRKGSMEIPRESEYYLECEKCGCSIREGRYCSFCVHEITGGIRGLMNEDIRKNNGFENSGMVGKMHFKSRR